MSQTRFKDTNISAVRDFIGVVEQYILLVDECHGANPETFLREAHLLVARLYAAGLELPPSDGGTDESPEHLSSSPREALCALFDGDIYYREVFDPLVDDDVVTGSLTDDLTDIYLDLLDGLVSWRAGHHANALWWWRFTLEQHAGDHMVDALRAMQRIARRLPSPDGIPRYLTSTEG